MSLICNGVYADTGDKAFEAETSYYLQFQINSSLVSIDYITNCRYNNSVFNSKAEYYHYYLDHLLYSIGQISTRFKPVNNNKPNAKEINERVTTNCKNYQFDENKYPILSNKQFRNTVEHIDEYNIGTILKYKGVGGFNYIDVETDKDLIEVLRKDRAKHIYTLDLLVGEVYIQRGDKELSLNINLLKSELEELKISVDSLLEFATGWY